MGNWGARQIGFFFFHLRGATTVISSVSGIFEPFGEDHHLKQ
jgi:hypothetical protein